jgi:hypothetical protein
MQEFKGTTPEVEIDAETSTTRATAHLVEAPIIVVWRLQGDDGRIAIGINNFRQKIVPLLQGRALGLPEGRTIIDGGDALLFVGK